MIISTLVVSSHALHDVEAGIAPQGADMLLGMSVLNRIGKFSADAAKGKLIFG